jgi:Skp family chaperone for outer membrane proteins
MRQCNIRRNWPIFALAMVMVMIVGYQAAAIRNLAQLKPAVIATVDLEKIFNRLDEREHADTELANLANDLQKNIDAIVRRINALEEELEVYDRGSDKYQETLEKLSLLSLEYQADVEWSRQMIEFQRAVILRRIYSSIRTFMETEASARGIDIVFVDDTVVDLPPGDEEETTRQISARRMLYTNPAIDITDEVIRRMNDDFGRRRGE